MPVVRMDVFTPWPEAWGLCTTCEVVLAQAGTRLSPAERGSEDLPPEWHAEAQRLALLLRELAQRYGERLAIRLWDPRSLQGMWRAVRHGVRRYPTFLIDGGERVVGWDPPALERALRRAALAGATAGASPLE